MPIGQLDRRIESCLLYQVYVELNLNYMKAVRRSNETKLIVYMEYNESIAVSKIQATFEADEITIKNPIEMPDYAKVINQMIYPISYQYGEKYYDEENEESIKERLLSLKYKSMEKITMHVQLLRSLDVPMETIEAIYPKIRRKMKLIENARRRVEQWKSIDGTFKEWAETYYCSKCRCRHICSPHQEEHYKYKTVKPGQ